MNSLFKTKIKFDTTRLFNLVLRQFCLQLLGVTFSSSANFHEHCVSDPGDLIMLFSMNPVGFPCHEKKSNVWYTFVCLLINFYT